MKKQILTKQDIQKELLAKLNKRKAVAIWLTAILTVSIICYIGYVISYANGAVLKNDRLSFAIPSVVIPIVPFIILFFIVFLCRYYYIDLYKIKAGKIEITEEPLCQKVIEYASYYRRSEKENSLYFSNGKVAVDKDVYSYSDVGDSFYIVLLSSKKAPFLVYHTKYYEIEKP